MMNPEAQLEFDRVTAIQPEELTDDEVAFLRARRAYLRPEQRQAFEPILKDIKPMTKAQKEQFEKENKKAVAQAKKEADLKAKEEKTIQESQNPNDN